MGASSCPRQVFPVVPRVPLLSGAPASLFGSSQVDPREGDPVATYSQLRVHIYPSEGLCAAAMVVRHRRAGNDADRLLWRGDVDGVADTDDVHELLMGASNTLREIAESLRQ